MVISPDTSCLCTLIASSFINIPHQVDIFVITHESTLTFHYHPKSLVYIRGHSWSCKSHGFQQIYIMTCIYHYSVTLHCPKNIYTILLLSLFFFFFFFHIQMLYSWGDIVDNHFRLDSLT